MTRPMSIRPHLLSTPPRQAEFVFAHETDGDGRQRRSNRLSEQHEADAGKWFLEAGFGRVDDLHAPLFANLNEAQSWIVGRLAHAA